MTQDDILRSPKAGKPRTCRYLTTAIPYVNAAPHIGFALEVVQADCLARLYRAQGCEVRLQAGTDDNSLKNVHAARTRGVSVEQLVRENSQRFYDLKAALDLSIDDFIRTSADDRHAPGVRALWSACAERGDIYKKSYSGLYCTGCEQFYKEGELSEGRCPEHGKVLEEIAEENYFFRLTRYEEQLHKAIASGEFTIHPEARRNEVLAAIERGLEDFSISRSAERAHGWGIPVPGDPAQVIYVWFDALANYITALGYGTGGEALTTFWERAATREHVIGKGITRFHAIYWPAILLSAGLALPTRLFVHGYVTVEGSKIGKSAGNAIDPVPLAREYGADALRYYLLRHIRSTEDGDFELERFRRCYASELAGQLGNLAHRVQSLVHRHFDGCLPVPELRSEHADELLRAADALPVTVETETGRFRFAEALSAVWLLVAQANKYVSDSEPWALARTAAEACDRQEAAAARRQLVSCLRALVQVLGTVGKCLEPLLPATGRELSRRFGAGRRAGAGVASGPVLFPRRP